MNAKKYFGIMPELLTALEAGLPTFRDFCLQSKMTRCKGHLFVGMVLDEIWCDKKKKCLWVELDFGRNLKPVIIELPYSILEIK